MTDPLETLALPLSWFDEDRELLGCASARPLSLASREALRLMGARLLRRDPGYGSVEEEAAEMRLYAWLHSAPLAEVTDALWSGAWRAVLEGPPLDAETLAETLPEWRELRARLAATVAATDYEVRARPRPASARRDPAEETPSDVVEPLRLAFRLRLLMRETGASREEALWLWPYGQAMQICHAAQRWEGQWTVRAMERTGPADFEGFGLAEEVGDQRSTLDSAPRP
jgi:hypothetical protein